MLNLASETDPSWSRRIVADLDALLLDHTHCEKKAASTAINLIFHYQDRAELMTPLSELAREELRHFERCLELLESRGVEFGRQRPSPYARELREAVRKQEPERFIDVMLCCALIEARSCERMKILSETLEDPLLAAFYGELLASEARHHMTYVDLAALAADRQQVLARLAELAAVEAEILANAPEISRMHAAGAVQPDPASVEPA
jgi:tRNA 2-(methylsulfanyl)-N6-isopentenyladenosine37 hydroxylase